MTLQQLYRTEFGKEEYEKLSRRLRKLIEEIDALADRRRRVHSLRIRQKIHLKKSK